MEDMNKSTYYKMFIVNYITSATKIWNLQYIDKDNYTIKNH